MKAMTKATLVLALLLTIFLNARAQDTPRDRYEAFKQQARQQYDDFRTKANKQYSEFLRQAWKSYKSFSPLPRPKDEEIKPVIFNDEEYKKARLKPRLKDNEKEYEDDKSDKDNKIAIHKNKNGKEVIKDDKGKPEDDNWEIKIDEIIKKPIPTPQPKPISPIYEQEGKDKAIRVDFYKLSCNVRLDVNNKFKLQDASDDSVADAWEKLSDMSTDNAIRDLLEARIRYNLCDWAYLKLIEQVANVYCGKGTDEAVLLTAYLFCQSGYKMRLATDGAQLYLLYGTPHTVFETTYWIIDGEYFYLYGEKNPANLYICDVPFPGEQALSLLIGKEQKLGQQETPLRNLKSAKYPNLDINVSENKVLMDFYDAYPNSSLGDNFLTRWALYADTPINEKTRTQLYQQLRGIISGKSKFEQVSMLLNWVQTAFIYEYDDKVWGHDRAFFPDETLYYPYCDCEDRSILFSRLVRDLVGLKVALVYYPGHLASAVCFEEAITGDYIVIEGKRFVIADPTFIGAPVGMTMMGMDNQSAKVIVL